MGRHGETIAIYELEGLPSLNTESASALNLGVSDSQTVRNTTCLLYISHAAYGIFVTVALND